MIVSICITLQLENLSSRWFSHLVHLYKELHRAYHNINHIYELISLVERFADQEVVSTNRSTITMAIFFHDAVYDIGVPHGDNETRSAALWLDFSNEMCHLLRKFIDDDDESPAARRGKEREESGEELLEGTGSIFGRLLTKRIQDWILCTVNHAGVPHDDAGGKFFSSIDLCILGKRREGYKKYASFIRSEYRSVPEDVYREKRSAILRELLSREVIYEIPCLHAIFESVARDNIQWEVDMLLDDKQPLIEDAYWR